MKVSTLGDSGVGKSSFISRLCEDKFTDRYKASIGTDFSTKQVFTKNKRKLETELTLQVWDTAGRERSSIYMFLRNSDALLIIYDVTNPRSFDNVVTYYQEIKNVSFTSPPCISLVGTKIDQTDSREISTQRGLQLASELGCGYYEVSSKSALNIKVTMQDIVDKIFTDRIK
uniref:Uncharacterized protein n=1 Tax=Arcella intermedia TaxID=1963864 RepID=A0A6B2LLN3_9EUKA